MHGTAGSSKYDRSRKELGARSALISKGLHENYAGPGGSTDTRFACKAARNSATAGRVLGAPS